MYVQFDENETERVRNRPERGTPEDVGWGEKRGRSQVRMWGWEGGKKERAARHPAGQGQGATARPTPAGCQVRGTRTRLHNAAGLRQLTLTRTHTRDDPFPCPPSSLTPTTSLFTSSPSWVHPPHTSSCQSSMVHTRVSSCAQCGS